MMLANIDGDAYYEHHVQDDWSTLTTAHSRIFIATWRTTRLKPVKGPRRGAIINDVSVRVEDVGITFHDVNYAIYDALTHGNTLLTTSTSLIVQQDLCYISLYSLTANSSIPLFRKSLGHTRELGVTFDSNESYAVINAPTTNNPVNTSIKHKMIRDEPNSPIIFQSDLQGCAYAACSEMLYSVQAVGQSEGVHTSFDDYVHARFMIYTHDARLPSDCPVSCTKYNVYGNIHQLPSSELYDNILDNIYQFDSPECRMANTYTLMMVHRAQCSAVTKVLMYDTRNCASYELPNIILAFAYAR